MHGFKNRIGSIPLWMQALVQGQKHVLLNRVNFGKREAEIRQVVPSFSDL
jgi:hypothetical protein